MSSFSEQDRAIERQRATLITRREAVRRVSALLGGVALVGQGALLTGCRDEEAAGAAGSAPFTPEEIAFLDEVAETILPETSTPGAKAAGVGPFMALMVTDTYDEREQATFREGMGRLDEASRAMYDLPFMEATPAQRLALLEELDREQKEYTDARAAAGAAADSARADAYLTDQRQQNVAGGEEAAAPAITEDAPAHYFRMMKELALLGYFTSEIGYTQAQRYQETPGRFDPCVPYAPGDRAWAPHA